MVSKEIIQFEANKIRGLSIWTKNMNISSEVNIKEVFKFASMRKYSLKLGLSKEDIIEIEKSVCKSLVYGSNHIYKQWFLMIILGSCAMSKDFDIIYDDELVNMFKSMIFYDFIGYFIEKNLHSWEFKNNKLLMSESTILGKIFNIYLYDDYATKVEKMYSLEESLSADNKELFFKYIYDNLGKIKFDISGKEFKPYSDIISNKLKAFLIEIWSEYGLYLIKNQI